MLTEQQLRAVFEKKYNRIDWYNVLRENFYVDKLKQPPLDITKRIKSNPYNAKAFELGSLETKEGHLIGLYEVEVPVKAKLRINRKGLRELLSQVYRNDVDAALIVFIQENKW